MKTDCVILYDRRYFGRWYVYTEQGKHGFFVLFKWKVMYLREWDLSEVPLNSKAGQRILARIGAKTQ